ncbi:MAG: 50S ribosomal protein L4 [Anaerolineales bacterium]|nr:50S ribosomal protein L4 [Anaerolineales bacterium]
MEVEVVNMKGKVVRQVDLPAAVFQAPLREDLMHQALVYQQANARLGTHKTKGRGEVSGGGRKPWKQKGTGRARQGSTRAPQWRGGGKVHTPVPRDYTLKMPRGMRRAALRSAISARVTDKAVVVVDRIALAKANTAAMAKALKDVAGTDNALVVLSERNEIIERSTRNLARAKTLRAGYLNVRDLFQHEKVVLALAAVEQIQEWLDPGRTK